MCPYIRLSTRKESVLFYSILHSHWHLPNPSGSVVLSSLSLCVSRTVYLIFLLCCHILASSKPWFLDGQWTADFRGAPHIDGSFLANWKDYGVNENCPHTIIQPTRDPRIQQKALDFVKVVKSEAIYDFIQCGKEFALEMEQAGDFDGVLQHN